MANNKVVLSDGTTLMDITDTTATANDVVEGKVFYGANGSRLVGTSKEDDWQINNAAYLFNDGARIDIAEKLYPHLQEIQNGAYLAQRVNPTSITAGNSPILEKLATHIKLDNSYVQGINLSNMFYSNSAQTQIDLTDFDTSNVNNMNSMFANCGELKYIIGLAGLNTSNVTNMNSMFSNCNSLSPTLDNLLLSFDTSKVTNFSAMFYHSGISGFDSGVKYIDLRTFDFSEATNVSGMFREGYSLRTIKMGKADTNYQKVTNSTGIFYDCQKLEKVLINGTSILPLTASSCLTNVPSTCEFYVPDNLVASYKSATNWSTRADYIFPISDYVEV